MKNLHEHYLNTTMGVDRHQKSAVKVLTLLSFTAVFFMGWHAYRVYILTLTDESIVHNIITGTKVTADDIVVENYPNQRVVSAKQTIVAAPEIFDNSDFAESPQNLYILASEYHSLHPSLEVPICETTPGQKSIGEDSLRLPPGLSEVENALYASLEGLAKGSQEAQNRQFQAIESLGLPLEVECNKTGMRFRLVPAGDYVRGIPWPESERPSAKTEQPKVVFSRSFYMSVYEVTQAQWKAVMNSEPWKGKEYARYSPQTAASYISWNDAMEFCKRMSRLVGHNVRLPTEAEWEYACRAGTTTAYYCGDDPARLFHYGVHNDFLDAYLKFARFVGSKIPNAWGLYDMHGNVWEWCLDLYQNADNRTDIADPAFRRYYEHDRVMRGGSWNDLGYRCQSSYRSWDCPTGADGCSGFRVVLGWPYVD